MQKIGVYIQENVGWFGSIFFPWYICLMVSARWPLMKPSLRECYVTWTRFFRPHLRIAGEAHVGLAPKKGATGWGLPVITWFINIITPINYSYISCYIYHKP